jgi:hypothetical protein
MCPKGDDPWTTSTDYHTITVATSASSSGDPLAGEFKFIFQGEYFYFPADPSEFDDETCTAAVTALANVAQASCTRGTIDAVTLGCQYTIQLQQFPIFPYQNNIYSHEGNPSIDSYQCDTTHITAGTSPTCEIQSTSTGTLPGPDDDDSPHLVFLLLTVSPLCLLLPQSMSIAVVVVFVISTLVSAAALKTLTTRIVTLTLSSKFMIQMPTICSLLKRLWTPLLAMSFISRPVLPHHQDLISSRFLTSTALSSPSMAMEI